MCLSAYGIYAIISTHTLTWSVTFVASALPMANGYFNSHAHVERDFYSKQDFPPQCISTHTLTWSVTSNSSTVLGSLPISTHTLTWSVTDENIARINLEGFQLTRSRGA